MSIGNDVVDLTDPETSPELLHPRFDTRVFGPDELGLLQESASRHRLRWALWAAKESAYKARARLEPGLPFWPREFEVEFDTASCRDTGSLSGVVKHRGRMLVLRVHHHPEWVHAVAATGEVAARRLLSEVGFAESAPSLAVRQLAGRTLGSALGLDPAHIGIVGRPPVAEHSGRLLAAGVSLSHHGRLVAVATALPVTAVREG